MTGASPVTAGVTSPRDPAARFVREGLGCRCPDEVFERVRTTRGVEVGGVRALWRIDVAGRLLVYVLELRDRRDLEAAVAAGRAERDRGGYQRLRVAVCDDEPARLAARLEGAWARLAAGDERLHLHVVTRAEVTGLCEAC